MFSGQGQSCEDYGTILDLSTHKDGLYVGFIDCGVLRLNFNHLEIWNPERRWEGTSSNIANGNILVPANYSCVTEP